MFPKNLLVYRLTETLNVSNIVPQLAEHSFVPCASLDPQKIGFIPPINGTAGFNHVVLGCHILCVKTQVKLLPAAAITAALSEKVKAIQETENRLLSRKERAELKDEIYFSMLPKAFTKDRLTFIYLDLSINLIFVACASASEAESALSKLREALGSLKCSPLNTANSLETVGTEWMRKGATENPHFSLGEKVTLLSKKKGQIVFKNMQLDTPQIQAHINDGMHVSKLELYWAEGATFSLASNLSLKSLKFSDVIADKANESNPETYADQFDADAHIFIPEIRKLLAHIVSTLGGLS